MNATHTRRIAAVAVLLAAPALSSCGVSFGAQTDKVYTPGVGVNNRDGQVDVLHALIVSKEDGSGRLVAGLANNDLDRTDRLTGVRGVGVDQNVTFTVLGGDAEIPAGGFLQLADPKSASVLATGDAVTPGSFVRLAFSFSGAEEVTLNVPVVSAEGDFAGVDVPDAPSESPSP